MHNSIRVTVVLTALPILFLSACAAPQMDLPVSIGPDIASRTGAQPTWSRDGANPAPDANSLQAAAVTALPNPLNEVDAVAIALDESPDIARMLAETDSLRSQALEIATPLNPVLNFSSGVPLDSLGVVPIFAMLMVQIDELWKQPIRSESARDSYEAALLSLGAEAVRLASDARSLWHEVAMREQECALAANDFKLTEQLLTLARDRFVAGEGDGNSVANAQKEFADAHHRGQRATENLNTTRLALMAILGRAEATVDWSVGSADPAAKHALHATLAQEPALLNQLAESRLDVRAAQARAKAAQSKFQLAQRSRIGRVEIGAGAERTLENQNAIGVAANIEIPIFNTGSFRIDKAAADYRAASIIAEKVRQTAIIELRSALAKARSAQNIHDVSESSQVIPATETAKRANDAMLAGELSQRDSMNSQHALTLARLELTDLERQRRSSRLALSKAAGFLPMEEFP
jgi:outer membrane protein TolC